MNTKRSVGPGRYRPLHQSPWRRIETVNVHGRTLTKGTECSIKGTPGRARFQYARFNRDTGAVTLCFVGGRAGHEQFLDVYPDRVRTVHRQPRTRRNAKEARQ